jgi:hypothetical protein
MPDVPYLSNIISALASGAVGAGLSRTMTHRLAGEDNDQYQKRLSLNTGIGALGGAATGAALPTIANSLMGDAPSNNPLNWITGGVGAAAGAIADFAGPLPIVGGVVGGYFKGRKAVADHKETTQGLQAKADALRTTYNSTVKEPTLRGGARAEMRAAETAVKDFHGTAGEAKWHGRGMGALYGTAGGFLADKLLSRFIQ